MTVCIRGKVILRTPATKHLISGVPMETTFNMLTECVVNANSPSHALLSLNSGEHLSRILKSDRSLAQRIHDGKEVDESRYT